MYLLLGVPVCYAYRAMATVMMLSFLYADAGCSNGLYQTLTIGSKVTLDNLFYAWLDLHH